VSLSSVLWTKNFGGLGEQSAISIIQDYDGGFALFGNTKESIDSGDNNLFLVKTDANGIMQWNKTYSIGKSDLARAIIQTKDGGYVLVGQTFSSFDTSSSDFLLIKTDNNGNLQWYQTYGQWFMDDPYSVIETLDGGFALFGTTLSIVGKLEDYFLVKTNSYGNMVWNKTYGIGDREFGASIIQTSDEGYVIGGTRREGNGLDSAYQVIKIDSLGNMEWNKTYGWNQVDGVKYPFHLYDLIKTSDEGFALGGTIRSTGLGPSNFLLVKTDENGNMQWNQTYREGGESLIQTFDEGYAFAGSYRNKDTFLDAWLIKTDLNGNIEINQNYSLTDRQEISSLIQTSDSGFALAGRMASLDDDNSDFWMLRTDEQGIPEFPSWIILPIVFSISFISIIIKKKFLEKKLQ
jgi:hypothetical protein